METGVEYRPGLNQQETLADRFAKAANQASRLHLGVAYAKSSGVAQLTAVDVPKGSRAVVGLGFGLTDPFAVQQLENAGLEVRVVPDQDSFSAAGFHPKLYLIEHSDRLTAFSGSANLTTAGWTTNVEQFEEVSFARDSQGATQQLLRFGRVWDHGQPLALLRRSGDWDRYRERARDRRILEREDRRRLMRLQAATGQLVGQLARRSLRAAPGLMAVTNDDWWERQIHLRDQTDRALFWRRNTKGFRALAPRGFFFHLVKDPTVPESQRAIRGFSVYSGDYEVDDARRLFSRYGDLLGVTSLRSLYEGLHLQPGAPIGVIHLEHLTELERPVTLEELRANGVPFAANIVSARKLTLEEVAVALDLGGLGTPDELDLAADRP